MKHFSLRSLRCKTFPSMNGQPAHRGKQKEQRRRSSERNKRSGWCFHPRQRWSHHQWWNVVDSVWKEGIQWWRGGESDRQKSRRWSSLGSWRWRSWAGRSQSRSWSNVRNVAPWCKPRDSQGRRSRNQSSQCPPEPWGLRCDHGRPGGRLSRPVEGRYKLLETVRLQRQSHAASPPKLARTSFFWARVDPLNNPFGPSHWPKPAGSHPARLPPRVGWRHHAEVALMTCDRIQASERRRAAWVPSPVVASLLSCGAWDVRSSPISLSCHASAARCWVNPVSDANMSFVSVRVYAATGQCRLLAGLNGFLGNWEKGAV